MSLTLMKKEDYLLQIRDNLRKQSIKLWLEPYYNENNGPCHEELKKLATELIQTLNKIPYDDCYEILLELQTKSLTNLKNNSRYKQSGLAIVKIKILNQYSTPTVITKELMLSTNVRDLKEMIAQEIQQTSDRIKLIYSGKVLANDTFLSNQGIKNGQQILAIVLTETVDEIERAEQQFNELENIESDSRLLASDESYMQLEDQSGNAVNIPEEERNALVFAMALHEKGRSAFKRNNLSKALFFFLEADEQFNRCNSTLLNSVDNYALLNLDIAWCYLCLQSVDNLPAANERLKKCEEAFHKSYGKNLERLVAVKGAIGNESALFMRLHLLQAILLYHQNKRNEALQLFKKANEELQLLKVDENSILMLVELGFTVAEARLALRANNGNVNSAANYIKENRDKRKDSRKKAQAEADLEKQRRELGKCADGKQYVEPNFLKLIVNMGYNQEAARNALQHCNNIISDSIQYIQDHPTPSTSQSRDFEMSALINDLLPQLEAAGFDSSMARFALNKHMGDITKAIEELLSIKDDNLIPGGSSAFNSTPQVEQVQQLTDTFLRSKEKEEAYQRLAEDITMTDDDHLDLTLEMEEIFLKQYLSLLSDE